MEIKGAPSAADDVSQVSARQSIGLARKRRLRCVFICGLKIGGILFSAGAVQWLEFTPRSSDQWLSSRPGEWGTRSIRWSIISAKLKR